MPSALDALVQPGADTDHILMRSDLDDARHVNAVSMCLDYCALYKINGKAFKNRMEYLMAQLAHMAIQENRMDIEEQARKDNRWWMFFFVIIVFCTLIAIAVLKTLWTTGKMPWQ